MNAPRFMLTWSHTTGRSIRFFPDLGGYPQPLTGLGSRVPYGPCPHAFSIDTRDGDREDDLYGLLGIDHNATPAD
eukprot:4543961-Karenia_brevis.AAC.1